MAPVCNEVFRLPSVATMDGEDEEFEKLLGEIPQAIESPADMEGLEKLPEHTISELECLDVPRAQSTESFQGLLQAFQPLSNSDGCSEESMYFPLPAEDGNSRETKPCGSMTGEETGRNALDLGVKVRPVGMMDSSYSCPHEEEDPYRFASNQSSLINSKTGSDTSLEAAFASFGLQEANSVHYKSSQANKMRGAERVSIDAEGLTADVAGLHGFNNLAWSARSDVGNGDAYGNVYLNSVDLDCEGKLLTYSDGRKNVANFRGSQVDSRVAFPLGSQNLHQQLEYPPMFLGRADNIAPNLYPPIGHHKNGMASYLQAQQLHELQLLQQLREEERRHRADQILTYSQPARCSPDRSDARYNPICQSFHVNEDHGYGFSEVGGTYSLNTRQHLQQQHIDTYTDSFCAPYKQRVCSVEKNHALFREASARRKDFLVGPGLYGNGLHKSTSWGFDDEKPPVRILSRKTSRVAAPSSPPLPGCSVNNINRSVHSEAQGYFHPPGPGLWKAPSDLENFRRHSLNPLQAPTDVHGYMYSSLAEIEGHILAVAKDQHGCRFLQRKFDEGVAEDVQKIFSEILDHAVELMVDPFGNYLIQKLLEVCTDDQRTELLTSMTRKGELISVSLNTHGTRAVQKLVETLNSSQQISIVTASLRSGVVTLIKDLNGNHVIQRCLQHLSNDDNEFIFEAAAYNCVEIATHRHGCCVLQRCIDHSTGLPRERLIHEIALNSLQLSQDSFGNYVVQYVLDLGLSWAREEVMDHLSENYARLSMQKFSSNVVEKCLQLSCEEGRVRIIRELIRSSHLLQLLQDPYANYVMQSALMVSKGTLHTSVVEAIRPHIPSLRSCPYGKRILSRRSFKKF